MRKILLILTFLLIPCIAWTGTIKFAPIPNMPKETLLGNYYPLVDYLNRKTGLSIELVYIGDYNTLIESIIAGKVHLISSGPLPYLEIKKRALHVKALAYVKEKDGKTKYRCVLVTSIDGPKRVAEIKGKIALPQKFSTCGYFSANIILSKAGKDIKKLGYKHFETHNEVIEAVIRKEFEAGMLKEDVAQQYSGFALRILDQSPEWPAFSIVVNTKVVDKTRADAIKKALLELDPNRERNLIVGKFGFAEAKEEDFEIMKKYEKYKPKF